MSHVYLPPFCATNIFMNAVIAINDRASLQLVTRIGTIRYLGATCVASTCPPLPLTSLCPWDYPPVYVGMSYCRSPGVGCVGGIAITYIEGSNAHVSFISMLQSTSEHTHTGRCLCITCTITVHASSMCICLCYLYCGALGQTTYQQWGG